MMQSLHVKTGYIVPKCIYCLKEKSSGDFSVEHVIPRQLGIFDQAPTLVGCVCAECNGLFSGDLENNLAESTHEGQRAKKLEIGNPGSLRVSAGFDRTLTGEDENADRIKWFLRFKGKRPDGVPITEPTSGVLLISDEGTKNVLWLETLIDAEKRVSGKQKRDYTKYKNLVARAKKKDIFISEKDNSEEIMHVLNEYGIDTGSIKFENVSESARTWILEERHTGGRDEIRMFAKIAFNYFAKVMEVSGLLNIVYDGSFDRIKGFILGDESISMTEICTNPGTVYIDLEKLNVIDIEIRSHYDASIEVKLQTFGGAVLRIKLGKRPIELGTVNLDIGHVFFPSERRFERIPPQAGSPTFLLS